MTILVDFRSALRGRTGVGEYIRSLVRAYAARYPGDVTAFTSSWRDRPDGSVTRDVGVPVIDRRMPVRLLNLLWHRAEWPPVEWLAGVTPDVVHAAHPLLIPARRAAQVVTIHDLFFLDFPDRTRAEIRRDYAALAPAHARRADAILTSSAHTARLIAERCGAPPDRIYVCPPGRPAWRQLGHQPNLPRDGYILFVGTLEPRKNIGALLDAYARTLARRTQAPRLLLAGRAEPEAAPWLRQLDAPPLRGNVEHLGYVADEDMETLYAGARLLVMPSLDEGFGLPVLAAMSAGVPVLASNRGSLPEVTGGAGVLVDPERTDDIADALERLIEDDAWAMERAGAGLERAQAFTWDASAATLRRAYTDATARRRARD